MMSFKIPCGGFRLDEKSFSLDENGVLSVSGGGSGGVTTLHINVTAVNMETMQATFTADKTPAEIQRASLNGPIWCAITFEAGTLDDTPVSAGLPPAWNKGISFGMSAQITHGQNGNNLISYVVSRETSATWRLDLEAFVGG